MNHSTPLPLTPVLFRLHVSKPRSTFGAQHSRPFPNRAKYSFSMQRAGVLPIFTAS